MSRAVARSGRGDGLPETAPGGPNMPPWIRQMVDAQVEPDPERRALLAGAVRDRRLDASSRSIARSAAAVLDGWLAPASPDLIRYWLAPIAASVKVGPSGPHDANERAAFVAAVALLGLPGRAFTQEAQREALRRWVFWPAAAEVEVLLGPVAARWRAQRAALLRLADRVEEAVPEAEVLGAEERAAIVRRFRARYEQEVLAPAVARAERVAAAAPRPARISDGALLDAYRAAVARGGPGAEAAAARVRMLESRLAGEGA